MTDQTVQHIGIPLDHDAIAALCRDVGVRSLDLFGSVTTESFDPAHSDIDVLVDFDGDGFEGFADRFFGLQDALARLFKRPVDLITDRSIENPYLQRQIDAQRRRVFPRP